VKTVYFILALTAVFLLCACNSKSPASRDESAAVITNASGETRAELEAAVARILKKPKVTVAEDALTESDILIISRTPRRTLKLNPVQGRSMEKPFLFQLVKIGRDCYLKYEATRERQKLEKISCRAINK
jgi:hypothetical protein